MANKDMSYVSAAHAMQSGVAMEQSRGSQCGTPKHLRVGVNSAMADHCALVRLLMSKGIITEAEYLEAIRLAMIEEVERYEKNLSKSLKKM